jgi:hypothetical protein
MYIWCFDPRESRVARFGENVVLLDFKITCRKKTKRESVLPSLCKEIINPVVLAALCMGCMSLVLLLIGSVT